MSILKLILFKGIKIFAICVLQILATKHVSIDDRTFEQLLINSFSKNQNIVFALHGSSAFLLLLHRMHLPMLRFKKIKKKKNCTAEKSM